MKKKIWGCTLVKNEDQYLWFAASSVIEYLDKLLIWDTGSTDRTLDVIKELQKKYPKKIIFEELGVMDSKGLSQARQKMLDETKADWFILIDGDEIWWKESIQKVVREIGTCGDSIKAIVIPVFNLVGDIYHFQSQQAGKYFILGKKGHFNIRAINRSIEGLKVGSVYPLEGYFDNKGRLLQELGEKELFFVDAPILHFTHLQRSSSNNLILNRAGKIKYEIGIPFTKDFVYPEVLYQDYPEFIHSPWTKMSTKYFARALIETPLKIIKRRIWR